MTDPCEPRGIPWDDTAISDALDRLAPPHPEPPLCPACGLYPAPDPRRPCPGCKAQETGEGG
jgi:hypothetical protein